MSERAYTINLNCSEDEMARQSGEIVKKQLLGLRAMTPKPEELEWEIRVYDYILEDPARRLEAYHRARFRNGTSILVPKRKAVATLGWNIP